MSLTIELNDDIENIKDKLTLYKTAKNLDIELTFIPKKSTENFNIDLIRKYIIDIKKRLPKTNIDFIYTYHMQDSQILNSNECKKLEEIDSYLRENENKELLISQTDEYYQYGFRKTMDSNRKLEEVANKIKNGTYNNKPLSPFEKYMLAYEYVTDFVYNEGNDFNHYKTSNWVPVMNGDKIVCAGYASLLKELCNRIFPSKEVEVEIQNLKVYDKDSKEYEKHANNLVTIKDEKYNINGTFYCDACWDSKKEEMEKSFPFCCLPLNDIKNLNDYIIELENKNISKTNTNTSIPLNAFLESFKIIGDMKGLKNEKLESFVQTRKENTINLTNHFFDTSKCAGTFAGEAKKQKTETKPNIKTENLIYELLDRSKIIYKRIEEQQKEISTNSNRAYDYQEQLTKCIKKYNSLETEDEKNTYLAENNYQSLKYNLCAYLNQIKKINSDIKNFNNYVNKLCIFQTNQTNINKDLENLITRSKNFCTESNDVYEKLLFETSLLLNDSNKESIEKIYKLISNYTDTENFSKQSSNLLDDALYNIKNLEKAANESLNNQEINIKISENNYDYKSVFNQTKQSNLVRRPNQLGKSNNLEITSGLNIPNITLEDVMNHSYRAHNLYDAKTYSLKGNDKFSDDEYVYQEFLSYVAYKMRENEQYLSEKLEGLHPSKKRELLENYLTETLVEITNEIKVNNTEVKLTGYTFQDCTTQFILRVNGYDIKRDTNIKDFLSGASRGQIIKSNPIDQKTFFKEFSENFKPTNYDDANIKRILNDGKGITNDDHKQAKIVKDKVEEFKNLIIELQKENNYKNYQTIIDKISDHQILKGLTKSEYNADNIYQRNIQFPDQMENFSMLISNNEKINFLDYKIAKEIYQKLSVDYKKTNKNATTDEKNELCNKALEQCDEILKNTKQIISTYASENTRSITSKPIIKQKIIIESVVQTRKKIVKQTPEINESIKSTTNNLETKENMKNSVNESLEKEKKELKEMIKKILQNATKQQVEEFMKSYKKNYIALASKCSEDDYQKIYEKFFFKAEDIVTKPEKITIEDIKTLGIYLGLENIDKTKIGQNTIKINDTQKIIDILESTTKQTTTIKK